MGIRDLKNRGRYSGFETQAVYRAQNLCGQTFHPAIFDLDTSKFEELSGNLIKLLNPKYRKLKKEISACYLSGVPFRDSKILLDLASLSEFEAHRLELENSDAKGKKILWGLLERL